jgi:hypothetical protein
MDGARSAQLQTTTELGSGQTKRVAQDPEQGHLGRDVNALSFPIKGKLNGCHWNPPQEFPKVYNRNGKKPQEAQEAQMFMCFLHIARMPLFGLGLSDKPTILLSPNRR